MYYSELFLLYHYKHKFNNMFINEDIEASESTSNVCTAE